MKRLFVLASYLYQSLAAIALIFVVSHVLESSRYTAFSLVAAFSQLTCVFAFEWLQISGTRFLSGARDEERPRLRAALYFAFALSSVVLLAVSPLALSVSAVSGRLAALALALAIAQGVADLLFMILRVEGRLSLSSALLVFRSTGLVVAAVAGAWLDRSTEAVLAGMIVGQVLGAGAALLCDRSLLRFSRKLVQKSDLMAFARYGLVAALASVVFLIANVMTRFLIVGRLGTASVAAAGFSMAFDLLQRPFSVLVAALNMVTYPEVVATYERASRDEARQATARLFELFLCSTLVLLAGLVVFLPDIAWLFVPVHLLDGFLAVATAVCVFAFVNIHLLVSGAVVLHLLKTTQRLVVIACGQLVAIIAVAATVMAMGGSAAATLFWVAAVSAIWLVVTGGPTYRFGAFPRLGLVLLTVTGCAIIGASAWLPAGSPGWLAFKIAIAAAVTLVVAWQGEFLRARPRNLT